MRREFVIFWVVVGVLIAIALVVVCNPRFDIEHVPSTGSFEWPSEPADPVRIGPGAFRMPYLHAATFLGDGDRFAILQQQWIRIFDTRNLKELRHWDIGGPISEVEFRAGQFAVAPNGKRIAIGSDMIRVWDTDNATLIKAFNLHVPNGQSTVWEITFSTDGKQLLSHGNERAPRQTLEYRSSDQGLRVWDVDSGTEIPAFKGGISSGMTGEFTPDGKSLVWRDQLTWKEGFGQVHMRSLDGKVDRSWNVAEKDKWPVPFAYFDHGVRPINWSFKIWDGKPESEIRTFPFKIENRHEPYLFRFSPDRRLVATNLEGLALWDMTAGTKRVLRPGPFSSLDFSRDGKFLIARSRYCEVFLFNVESGQEQAFVNGPKITDVPYE